MKKSIEQILFLGARRGERKERCLIDTLLGLVSALCLSGIILLFGLYPKIPNITFLYLLAVLLLATTRGLYAALVATIVAFLSFDYLLVDPIYTFTIHRFEEWLALFICLLISVITGQLAARLRQQAEEAKKREGETRALYNLVRATLDEENLERQLQVVADSILQVFLSAGVRDCAILLPDERGVLTLRADACHVAEHMRLSADEAITAESAMREGKIVDLYLEDNGPHSSSSYWFRRDLREGRQRNLYVRMLPLRVGVRVIGVARLLVEDDSRRFSLARSLRISDVRKDPQQTFFWTFLDQATAVIDRARLQQENLQVELLRRTDALRTALLSSVSHDLRTPLASIKAAASSLLQEDVEWNPEERRSFAQAIETEADRLNRLVGNLLDMSRIEGGALKPEKEWYLVNELIYDVLERLSPMLRGREVRTTIPDELPPVEIDYLQMDQVLTNLIENAVRYTPPASPIEVSVEARSQDLLISVGDYGPGIPPADIERIFDKFYRVLETKRKNTSIMGSGLGLAVCRGLVEAHGGRIWAENREGGGALFRFTLPLEKGVQEG
ncbi:two-component system sensor histidine kinase KdpD [Thermosporothrix hazakensis]|jgi:two-component system sensor histidine kinase KdpD|uniref:histidine kinase n=1 Tax=Thermosporothrix hazakensis TaxID=644383 RepID=A0A326U977_THEHA|nr:ATP-binding protein [Thermosporothrix hazakensis]PZW31967.1 two-component system sensor histidine kinase KdpD [Thermosporothrix hazakensis]